MNSGRIDFTELRETWTRRRARVGGRHIDPRGATKPARDPDEAAFLKSIGRESVFTEVEMPGWKEWLRWRNTPPDQRDNSLRAVDFCPPENR
jgi:hypothetical protein